MGLKVLKAAGHGFECVVVEIRPRWDWKGENQRCGREDSDRLKSDQDGIERALYRNSRPDQRLCVEIRPRWDWKELVLIGNGEKISFCWNQTKMGLKDFIKSNYRSCVIELKSDQDGIERKVIKIKQGNITGWNQTKMGLKGNVHSAPIASAAMRWNQTKMGL